MTIKEIVEKIVNIVWMDVGEDFMLDDPMLTRAKVEAIVEEACVQKWKEGYEKAVEHRMGQEKEAVAKERAECADIAWNNEPDGKIAEKIRSKGDASVHG